VPVARDDDGRLVMVKRADPGHAADRLRREAEALQLAAGAGGAKLVELVDEAGGGVRLVTAWVGGGTLATARRLGPARVLAVGRALAASLTELHRRGLVHGAVAPEHVLFDGDRPVLCGLGGARLPGDDGGPSADEDVAALLTMIEGLLADAGGPLADRLRAVVAAGGGGGAVAVADRLAALVPAEPPRREVRPRRPPAERRPPVRGLVVTGAAAVVLLALATATWRSTAGSGPPPAPSTTTPTAPACPTARGPSADVDGDGCAEAVGVAGGVVTVGDRRWRVGHRDDLATVADWDCDGRATAAVVRPTTGEVWVYDRWASAGRPVPARPGPDAPGATAARAMVAGDGCARLEVTTPEGRRILRLR
jgi:tRNA A-37 threonylcarbamoyl transferase component Bud32